MEKATAQSSLLFEILKKKMHMKQNRVDDKFETLLDHIEELKKAIVDLSERIK